MTETTTMHITEDADALTLNGTLVTGELAMSPVTSFKLYGSPVTGDLAMSPVTSFKLSQCGVWFATASD